MSAAPITRPPPCHPSHPTAGRPALTAAVFGVTLVVSVAAVASPTLMRLFATDAARLRTGQWWRAMTPVLVQPSGWGQLAFNLLGIALVGAALQRRLGWAGWSLVYLAGGIGTVALYIVWHPDDTGDGGSSAAVAALIGALAVLLSGGAALDRLDRSAQLYSVFFAGYLTTLQLGGVWPAVIAGDVAIAVLVHAHRLALPTTATRAGLAVVLAGGITMAAVQDDHGAGILIGATIASLISGRRQWGRRRTMSGPRRPAPCRRPKGAASSGS